MRTFWLALPSALNPLYKEFPQGIVALQHSQDGAHIRTAECVAGTLKLQRFRSSGVKLTQCSRSKVQASHTVSQLIDETMSSVKR